MDRDVILIGALALHLAVAAVHGTAHGLMGVGLPLWQNALVALTTFLGPVAGVALAIRDHPVGVPLFTVSMASALALGGLLHFVVESPDHVLAVPSGEWRALFQASALGVLLTPTLGVAAGVWAMSGRPE